MSKNDVFFFNYDIGLNSNYVFNSVLGYLLMVNCMLGIIVRVNKI